MAAPTHLKTPISTESSSKILKRNLRSNMIRSSSSSCNNSNTSSPLPQWAST